MASVLHGLTSEFAHGRAFSEVTAIANPAAATGFTYTVPGSYWERGIALAFTLVTDNNAANRQVTVTVNGGDGIALGTTAAGGVQAASLTRTYSFLANVATSNAVAGSAFVAPFPAMFLQPEFTVVVAIGSVQAGDQLSLIRFYRERFDTGPQGYPLGMIGENMYVDQYERLGD